MNKIPEEIVKLAENGEVKVKQRNLRKWLLLCIKAFIRKGRSILKVGTVNRRERVRDCGPSVTVCYNDSHTTLEEEQVSECLFPVRKRR